MDVEYSRKDCFIQYRGFESLCKQYVAEPLLNPFISYPDMENLYHIQIIDLRFHLDHVNPNKNQPFQEKTANVASGRLFAILIGNGEIKTVSHGKKILKLKLYKMTKRIFKKFSEEIKVKR